MDWTDIGWIKQLALPPGLLLLVALVALACRGRAARLWSAAAILALTVTAMPVTDRIATLLLERAIPAVDPGLAPAAIVVLSGDYRTFAPEYGEATVGAATLMRLRHAAVLHRRTGLPILASGGGTPPDSRPGMGEAMRIALERDFAVPVRWLEGRSRNTLENAIESARMLRGEGIATVMLVTHATHMPRAVRAFAAAGLRTVPAPAGGIGRIGGLSATDLLPGAASLQRSTAALHELAGLAWYEIVIAFRAGATK
jgi:uncharacterized SAM-binding protein YcdF (DUF218 family)